MNRALTVSREEVIFALFYITYALGAGLLLLAFYIGELHLWNSDGPELIRSPLLAGMLGILLMGIWHVPPLAQRTHGRVSVYPFATLLGVIFFTHWFSFSYSLYPGLSFRGEILLCTLVSLAAIIFRKQKLVPIWLLLSAVALVWAFFAAASGRLIFADDHTAVFYRLQMLKDNFPFIPFYNPFWNAGLDARDFFATGILNVFLLFAPLIYAFPLENIYNLIVTLIIFGLMPVCSYFASRVAGLSRFAALCAALLSLTCCTLWYRWALSYGAMGFVASGALLPLCYYLAVKLISTEESFSWKEAVVLVIGFSLMLCWSLTALVFIPLLLVPNWRRVIRRKYFKRVSISIALINIPWILIFIVVSNVLHFTQLEKHSPSDAGVKQVSAHPQHAPAAAAVKGRAKGFSPESSLRALREVTIKTNPLILFLAFPGVALLVGSSIRRSLIFTSVWLLFLGTIFAPLKPQLELERMLIFLAIILCVPTAQALERIWNLATQSKRHLTPVLLAAICFGFLLSSTFAVGFIVRNRSIERHSFAQPIVANISEAIKTHGGAGRTLFSSFILHQLSGGHVAPLVYFSGKPIIASSPVHNLWWFTDAIPAEFRARQEEGIEEYLDLMNVTAVVAFDEAWREYFSTHPERYEKKWQEGSFMLFARNYPESSYFVSGTGRVAEFNSNSVTVELDSPQATLKFIYYPFLQSDNCRIRPAPLSETVTLVELYECTPGKPVTISSITAFRRIYKTLRGAE